MPAKDCFNWDDDAVSLLKSMCLDGWTGGQIAGRLGISRGSAIGKIHRMGFHLKRKRGYAAHTRKEYTERLAADRQIDLSNPKCLPLPIAGPNPSVMVLCTLLELTEQSCRFPIGQPADPNFRFCGNQRADDKAPYCAHHMKLTHTTSAQRREQPRGFNYYVPTQI